MITKTTTVAKKLTNTFYKGAITATTPFSDF